MKRRLTSIRLDKIAAVDDPCQEHATVAIMKRNFTPEKRKELADKGHAMPDGSFPIETVADLKNAIAAFGRAKDPAAAKKHIIARARALKAIDELPADWDVKKALAKATFGEALEGNLIAGAVNDAFFDSFDGLWQRNDAFRVALTDELATGGDGSTASADYVASVKALVDEAVSQARDAGATASDTGTVDKSLNAAVEKWLESKKEQTTMKITNRAELQAAVSKFAVATSTVADAQAIQKAAKDLDAEDLLPADGPLAKAKPDPEMVKVQRELAVLKLSPVAKSHFDGLDEAGQTAFLAKSDADRQAEIDAASSKDPVVYKCKDGTEIRKSDGSAVLALAKRNDEQAEELAKLRGETNSSTIEKRAAEKYPHVAKGVAADMLKSVDQIGKDTDAGKAMLASLDQMEKAGGRLFKTIGTTEGDGEGGGPAGIAKSRTDFDTKVSEIASRDKIGKADAMSKARVEHPDLFKAAYPETVQAVEDHEIANAAE